MDRLPGRGHPVRAQPLPPGALTMPPAEVSRRLVKVARTANPLLCFPDPMPSEWAKPLGDAGYDLVYVSGAAAAVAVERAGNDSWTGAVVCATDDMTEAIALCRHLRRREEPIVPLLLI